MQSNSSFFLIKILRAVASDPRIIIDFMSLRSREEVRFEHRRRRKMSDVVEIMEAISRIPPISASEVLKLSDVALLQRKFLERGFRSFHILLALLLYLSKPETIVETGVADGVSSYFILRAIDQDQGGRLYSIDLPSKEYRFKIGWMVPTEMRDARWRLILGTSRDHLLNILNDLKRIDMFCHDSEHSYENMLFEYRTAWPFIKYNGFLVSDDINDTKAFDDFVNELPPGSMLAAKFGDAGFIQKIKA